MGSKPQELVFPGCGTAIFGNAGARGYYRSGYDAENLKLISSSAERDISAGERYLLLNDVIAQVSLNRLSAGDVLTLARDMKDDTSADVMNYLSNQLRFADDYLLSDADRDEYRAWVRATFGPVADKLGWVYAAGDSDETRSLPRKSARNLGGVGRDLRSSDVKVSVHKALNGQSVDPTMLSFRGSHRSS